MRVYYDLIDDKILLNFHRDFCVAWFESENRITKISHDELVKLFRDWKIFYIGEF